MLATANAEVVDDCAAYPEDSDTFATITFKAYKIASLSKLPINFINDTKFDVEGYLKNEYGMQKTQAKRYAQSSSPKACPESRLQPYRHTDI